MKEDVQKALAVLFTALAVSASCDACSRRSAESAYTAALLRCVDEAKTLEQSRECRRFVDGNYGITVTVTDGGKR